MAEIKSLLTDLKRAQHLVFLTGAGVSTHSGIPDYRSKAGLYADQVDPEYLLSNDNLVDHPEAFYRFVQTRMYYPDAKPNLIHTEIAKLCNQRGQLITQNVDGLDLKAGNQHVIEFHGNLYDLYCQKCGQQIPYTDYAKSDRHQADQGIIRPRIVLYGEQIEPEHLTRSVAAMQSADLILIVGTSFRVYPFAQLLQYRNSHAKIYVINNEKIDAPGIEMIQDDALTIFKKISEVF